MEMKKYLSEKFSTTFENEPERYLSCGGRFEVLGNHTDHNHGVCLAATCDLCIYGAIKKREDLTVRLLSEGFGYFEFDLSSLDKNEEEVGKPSALVRGIAKRLDADGFKYGGFDIYIKSEIPNGAGVSSSAAFELLIAQAFNLLFNDNAISLTDLCIAGQYAEKNYYGKMCGLLDQIGVAFGDLVYIDFKDVSQPIIEKVKASFNDYQFVIVNTGGSHAELSDLYDAIPKDMFAVSDFFGQSYLRNVDFQDFLNNKNQIIEKCGLQAYERGTHFFNENQRVQQANEALKKNDIPQLIQLMNDSRKSSTELLHNMYVKKKAGSPLEACELIYKASHKKAGVKINGGGFAGSVIALVPKDVIKEVLTVSQEKYGKENVHLINIRSEGPCELL